MFAADDPSARVVVAVVAYGDGERVRTCLDALTAHRSQTPFRLVCVINPDDRDDADLPAFPPGVDVLRPEFNLGWAGGLHLVRSTVAAEFLVWAQDDMVVAEGWLDALVETADRHPRAGAVGSVEVDPVTRQPNGFAGGYAEPAEAVREWNASDVIRADTYVDGQPLDWITSKGMLTRTRAWDDVRGPDPRLFPLNHVDKDYCTHLRAHGWQLVLARDAQLIHGKHRSAPMTFRHFLEGWQEPGFNRRWGPVAASLGRGQAREVSHTCASWPSDDPLEIERLVGMEASRMIVPSSRYATRQIARLESRLEESEQRVVALQRESEQRVSALRQELERIDADYRSSTSWRITAPFRWLRRVLGRRTRE